MITSGAISVLNGMLPAMKTTEPYSPRQRDSAKPKPVSAAGKSSGMTTRQKVRRPDAPMT